MDESQIPQLRRLMRRCMDATADCTVAVNFGRSSTTATKKEEAAYQALFKFLTKRKMTEEELDEVLL
jgi:hypothetical protein